VPASTCCVCHDSLAGGERFVLVRNGREELHCSQSCLVANVQARQRARAAVARRWLMRVGAVALVLIGVPKLWHRVRLPQAQSISLVAEDVRPAPPPRPAPVFEGPAWPPTDDDWLFAFRNTAWSYPLPGPVRHQPTIADGRNVDVGADLWGEHVYAVHDGTVDHVQHAGGEVSLRLVHFGGMVFTHYAHLAAVPRTIRRGAEVKAGDVIGLVGDTGGDHPGHYLRFGLSIRPSSALPEVYWDPRRLMAKWPGQIPTRGTVAGFLPPESDLQMPPIHHHPR
jgi:murein DD-endopeptidase MepM/ murein hydrolase activator NlpD